MAQKCYNYFSTNFNGYMNSPINLSALHAYLKYKKQTFLRDDYIKIKITPICLQIKIDEKLFYYMGTNQLFC